MDKNRDFPIANYKRPSPLTLIGQTVLFSFGAGAGVGFSHAFVYYQRAKLLQKLNCVAYYTVPITAMGTTFGVISYAASRVRGKKDVTNGIIGVIASGGILQLWKNHGFMTWSYVLFTSGFLYIAANHGAPFQLMKAPRMVANFYRSYYESRPEKWEM